MFNSQKLVFIDNENNFIKSISPVRITDNAADAMLFDNWFQIRNCQSFIPEGFSGKFLRTFLKEKKTNRIKKIKDNQLYLEV